MKHRSLAAAAIGLAAVSTMAAAPLAQATPGHGHHHDASGPLGGYKNVVVIYQENHSFDNIYGSWGRVGRDRVNGLKTVKQVDAQGTAFDCLLQNDVNLTSPNPLPVKCSDQAHGFDSAFANKPYRMDDYIGKTDTTCPPPGAWANEGFPKGTGEPGGCTRDLVHRFYQEQYQIDGGKQDRYVTGSDAVGTTMGVYDTKDLGIYKYLHAKKAPNYVIADNFYQAAFGGSFLNHQWLIAARSPLDTSAGAMGAKNSVLDANGMPVNNYPLYKSDATGLVDGQLTQKCADGANHYDQACGNYAVNTTQPAVAPFGKGAQMPLIDDAKFPNIGDRMTAAGVSWNWYSGGWDDAEAGHPGALFQYHHQPFNYFKDYAPGTAGRAHLQDETKFIDAAKKGTLPQVSFVKPYGAENEHPGYASEHDGSDHLVDLVKSVVDGPQGKDTLVVITYDEFGGQYDHASVPTVDAWGPGTRIPAMLISGGMKTSGVDHTQMDTTSILATIEHQYGLAPLGSRDAAVNDLGNAVDKGGKKHDKHCH